MKKEGKYYWLIAVAMIILSGIFFWPKADEKNDAGKIQTVSFCGTKYQAPVIILEGVNVIQRIAEIATEQDRQQAGQDMCNLIRQTNPNELVVSVAEEIYAPGNYTVHLNSHLFHLNSYGMISRPGEHGLDVGWGRWRE